MSKDMSGYIPPYIRKMMDHMYLSDQRASIDLDKFKLVVDLNFPQNGVKLGEVKDEVINGTRILRVGVVDSDDQDMIPTIEKVLPVINEYTKASHPVLIYSHEGWGRNVMVLSSYLIKKYGFKLIDLNHVFQTSGLKQSLNPYFIDQLELISKE